MVSKQEDVATKVAWRYFKDEVLPYFGIEGTVAEILPTEEIHLELKKGFEDMNFRMEDGTIKHFEFQSTNEGVIGLKRFRLYEALLSYQFNTSVETYVLFSGNIKNPMTEFTEGINTFKIHPIIMSDKDANEVITRLQDKVSSKERIEKPELLALALTPLMGGLMVQKERMKAVYQITRHAITDSSEDLRKVEALIYIMADKFLDTVEMEELKEEIKMTRLGQMLYEDGKTKGFSEGRMEGRMEGVLSMCKKLGLLKSDTIQQVIEHCGKTFEEAKAAVEKYWD